MLNSFYATNRKKKHKESPSICTVEMLSLLPYTEYLRRMIEPRNVADIMLVFVLVYGVLKLLRGTRAAPMTAGIAALVFLYWLSIKQDLATLEFVLSNGLLYI